MELNDTKYALIKKNKWNYWIIFFSVFFWIWKFWVNLSSGYSLLIIVLIKSILFRIIFSLQLIAGEFCRHRGYRFKCQMGWMETIFYERIWQVVKNASLWNRDCLKKEIIACLSIEFSHYISYWNFMPVPHEIIGLITIN